LIDKKYYSDCLIDYLSQLFDYCKQSDCLSRALSLQAELQPHSFAVSAPAHKHSCILTLFAVSAPARKHSCILTLTLSSHQPSKHSSILTLLLSAHQLTNTIRSSLFCCHRTSFQAQFHPHSFALRTPARKHSPILTLSTLSTPPCKHSCILTLSLLAHQVASTVAFLSCVLRS
jgi:hypothetical protein